MVGAGLSLYEVALGFIIREFWTALLLMCVIKIFSFTLAFFLARYFLR
jgi:hypothetical protein